MIRKQVIAYAPGVERSGSDIRSATTIRDQLMLHCEITTCNASHLRIDPQGFALENFDPTGGLRNKYRRLRGPSPRVDATRVVPSGERFDGVSGLKQVLPDNHREQLARNLSKKLLTCATGRVTETADDPAVAASIDALDRQDADLRDLLVLIVQSEPFRHN